MRLIKNGYMKYHLWTSLYSQHVIYKRPELSYKEAKQECIDMYFQYLKVGKYKVNEQTKKM